jgi:uncharacterized protein YecE (DUF72 family)
MELKGKLGPINWQLTPTKAFDPTDFEAFLKLLPKEVEGRALRHVVEVRHDRCNQRLQGAQSSLGGGTAPAPLNESAERRPSRGPP